MTYFKRNNAFVRLESSGEGFVRTEVIIFSGDGYKSYFIENKRLTKDKAIDILCGLSPSSEDEFNNALSEAKEWIEQL